MTVCGYEVEAGLGDARGCHVPPKCSLRSSDSALATSEDRVARPYTTYSPQHHVLSFEPSYETFPPSYSTCKNTIKHTLFAPK